MAVEDQVCVVYAGVRGFLDKVLTSEIAKFESKFLVHLKTNHAKLLDAIRTTGDLSKANDAELKSIIETFLVEAGIGMKAWGHKI